MMKIAIALLASLALSIRTFLGLNVTVQSAVADLNAVITKVERAADRHANQAAAHSVAAAASQAAAVSEAADADRAKRVSAKLAELLG